jgi:hypothetical protein
VSEFVQFGTEFDTVQGLNSASSFVVFNQSFIAVGNCMDYILRVFCVFLSFPMRELCGLIAIGTKFVAGVRHFPCSIIPQILHIHSFTPYLPSNYITVKSKALNVLNAPNVLHLLLRQADQTE